MYKLPEDDLKLLNKLLLMKDLNPEDGYSKEKVIEYILTQIESWKRQNLTRYVIMYQIRISNMDFIRMVNQMSQDMQLKNQAINCFILWKMKVINKCSYFLFLSYLCIDEVANCISDIISSINLVNRFIDFFVRSISCYLVTILSTKYHLFIGLMN